MSSEQRIGLFFLVGLVLLAAAVELTLGLGLFHRRYQLHADFTDVQGLDRGADVRLAGLRAGRVQDLRLEGDHVRVTMAIDGNLTVRRDAVAKLDFRALRRERVLSLTLGSPTAPPAGPDDVLTGETPAGLAAAVDQLARVAQTVDQLASTLDADAGRLLVSLADVVEENRTALNDVASHVASISQKLDRGTGTLGKLLNDPALYDGINATVGDARQSVQDLGVVAQNLRSGQAPWGSSCRRTTRSTTRCGTPSTTSPARGATRRRSPTGCAPARARWARPWSTTRSTTSHSTRCARRTARRSRSRIRRRSASSGHHD